MRFDVILDKEDIREKIPFEIVAEASTRSVWGTGRRKRLMAEVMNKEEMQISEDLIRKAKRWMLKGLPEEYSMPIHEYTIWMKLEHVCKQL